VFLRKSKNTSLMQALFYQIRRKAAIDDDDHLDLSTTSTVCDSRFVLGLRPLFSNLQHCHVIGQEPQSAPAGRFRGQGLMRCRIKAAPIPWRWY